MGYEYIDYIYEEDIEIIQKSLDNFKKYVNKLCATGNDIEQFNYLKSPTLALKCGEPYYLKNFYKDMHKNEYGTNTLKQWCIFGDKMIVELAILQGPDSPWWAITVYISDDFYLHISNYSCHPYISYKNGDICFDFGNSDGSTNEYPDRTKFDDLKYLIQYCIDTTIECLFNPAH